MEHTDYSIEDARQDIGCIMHDGWNKKDGDGGGGGGG
jgi:hypothetical protein